MSYEFVVDMYFSYYYSMSEVESKMEDYPLNFIEPQVNESFMLCFSSFITEMRKRDHTNNFTIEHIFPTRNELIQ